MPEAVLGGITTRYEVVGSGPPLLMFAPGGFNATVENWTGLGLYRRLRLLDHLPRAYTCVLFDRREAGRSGGRVQRLTWHDYAAQGRQLLAHLGYDRAHLMGACVGCSIVAQFAVDYPEATAGMVLFSPAGGPHYRMTQHERFAAHEVFVREHGLEAVVELARTSGQNFSQDPRVGPWAGVLRRDEAFAAAYAATDRQRYLLLVRATARTLFDRDTVPGPEPEELLALTVPSLVVPGQDRSHAPSAARYLQECLPDGEYWDVPVAAQTEPATAARLREFLAGTG